MEYSMLTEVYRRLFDAFGPQKWWPATSPFEMIVGAVLTQNTSWRNVERALDNLRQSDLLEPHALYGVPVEELEELIRPAGYFRVKARRLRSLVAFLVDRYDGSLEAMFAVVLPDLRQQLLEVHGVGPETADSILLYAGGLPSFVVDTYTHRIFARHGWIGFDADYDQTGTMCKANCRKTRRCTTSFTRCWCRRERTTATRRIRNVRNVRCAGCCRRAGRSNRFRPILKRRD